MQFVRKWARGSYFFLLVTAGQLCLSQAELPFVPVFYDFVLSKRVPQPMCMHLL